MNAYFDAMIRYFDFRGRSTRAQYWWFIGIVAVLAFLWVGLTGAGTRASSGSSVAEGLFVLVHLVPSIAVTVRRLHDSNQSGWLYLLLLIPVAGALILILFMCTPSTPGSNTYGPPVTSPEAWNVKRHMQADYRTYSAQDGSPVEPSMNASPPSKVPAVQPPNAGGLRPQVAPQAGTGDVLAQLERLAALRASGVLDDLEFQAMNANLLQKPIEG